MTTFKQHIANALMISLIGLATFGCGQKGPLYLPEESEPEATTKDAAQPPGSDNASDSNNDSNNDKDSDPNENSDNAS